MVGRAGNQIAHMPWTHLNIICYYFRDAQQTIYHWKIG